MMNDSVREDLDKMFTLIENVKPLASSSKREWYQYYSSKFSLMPDGSVLQSCGGFPIKWIGAINE